MFLFRMCTVLNARMIFFSGNFLSDLFWGRELNPRLGQVDLKMFFVMNVGFVSWALIDSLVVYEAYRNNKLNATLLVVALFQLIFIVDALLFQASAIVLLWN